LSEELGFFRTVSAISAFVAGYLESRVGFISQKLAKVAQKELKNGKTTIIW
jgi:hypothetical protein